MSKHGFKLPKTTCDTCGKTVRMLGETCGECIRAEQSAARAEFVKAASRRARNRAAVRKCARNRRARFEALGTCLNCGKDRAPGKKICPRCLDSMRASYRKYAKTKRAAFRALGICIDCREAEAVPDRMRCGYCQEKEQERKVERRHAKKRMEIAA